MHLFMHHGHGGHGGQEAHGDRTGPAPRPSDQIRGGP
jgi:hypothetical protein